MKRPQFEGQYRFNPATGEIEKHYPWTRRALKFVVTASFTLLGLVGVGFLMVYIFSTRDELVDQLTTKPAVNNTDHNVVATTVSETSGEADMSSASLDLSDVFAYADREEFWLALSLPSALYGLMIPILDFMFHGVAVKANQWENHATESAYRNHLVWKVFPFRFFNSFVSLFYYAFSTRHSILVLSVQVRVCVRHQSGFVSRALTVCMRVCLCLCLPLSLLSSWLASWWAVRSGTTSWRSCCLACVARAPPDAWRRSWNAHSWTCPTPLAGRCCDRRRATPGRKAGSASTTRSKTIRRCVRQSHGGAGSWPCAYSACGVVLPAVIQFGYVTCFSMAFSLAPLVALLNNFIEIRADAYKLCYNTQRPHARKAGGIGTSPYMPIVWPMYCPAPVCLRVPCVQVCGSASCKPCPSCPSSPTASTSRSRARSCSTTSPSSPTTTSSC